jgi:DNA-directed RNA polymerase specialized sigma24 family protein
MVVMMLHASACEPGFVGPEIHLSLGGGKKMTISTINSSEEHSQHIGQIYREYYARLRRYFLAQLGNASEADHCAQETIRCFFFFMEDRCWEADAEYIPVYLMRIAGFLCSRKLAEKRLRRSNSLDCSENNNLFNKVKNEVVQAINEFTSFRYLFLRPVKGNAVSGGF